MTKEEKENAIELLFEVYDCGVQRKDVDLTGYLEDITKALNLHNVMHRLPSDIEIKEWWRTQKFQKEQGEQEYTMIYEVDLPKILRAFIEHLLNGA